MNRPNGSSLKLQYVHVVVLSAVRVRVRCMIPTKSACLKQNESSHVSFCAEYEAYHVANWLLHRRETSLRVGRASSLLQAKN